MCCGIGSCGTPEWSGEWPHERRQRSCARASAACRIPISPTVARRSARRLGKVAAPPNKESTSEFFYFWVERGKLVERTQIVTTSSQLGDRTVEFVGLVEEVYRQSRQRDMGEEVDRFDADSGMTPPFASAGFTYAKVTILRTDPVTHAPPTEESTVYLGGQHEAEKGYGVDRMGKPLAIGLLRNGGTAFAGPARIDLDYLLGENGGHLNVNGIAGLGAKSSFLLHVNYLLLREAERQTRAPGRATRPPPGRADPLQRQELRPVLHRPLGQAVGDGESEALPEWQDTWASTTPTPFRDVQFFAPQEKGGNPVDVGRHDEQGPGRTAGPCRTSSSTGCSSSCSPRRTSTTPTSAVLSGNSKSG